MCVCVRARARVCQSKPFCILHHEVADFFLILNKDYVGIFKGKETTFFNILLNLNQGWEKNLVGALHHWVMNNQRVAAFKIKRI